MKNGYYNIIFVCYYSAVGHYSHIANTSNDYT